MKNIMTNEHAWNWLGNRGVFVPKRDVRVRGMWAFVRYPDQDGFLEGEVLYYHLDGGMYAEALDSVRLYESPFAASKDTVDATVKRITAQFYEDYPEERPGSCLVAISGDCAAGGLGSANEVLPFDDKHMGIVVDYLRAQFEFFTHCHVKGHTGEVAALYTKLSDAVLALQSAGVFHHKYHARTQWELAYIGEVVEMKRFRPYVIIEHNEEVQVGN